jgi:UDP-2,3-diacylglucosamine pyrophosphatase LpxH
VTYKEQYSGEWQRHVEIKEPYFTIFLIGDAGNAPMDSSTQVFDHLKKALDEESANSATIWLGDNIYPVGLAPSSSPYYPKGKHKLLAQLKTMSDYRGYKFFVPGNHDWYTFGRIGLRRQELLVDSFLLDTPNPNRQTNFFYPDKGCGDPQVVSLAEGISLLLMDSHWFLNEKARSGDQEVCAVQTPQQFIDKLHSEIISQEGESLIVASHHPPYTYAHHGGKFPFKDDFFPLTQVVDWLYLPLPASGFIFNRIRTRISEQDVNNALYKTYRGKLVEALEQKGRSIIASGHEHTLQYIENHNQCFIVSGSGTKNNKVGMGQGSEFAIGERGYVKVIFKNSKEALLQFIVPGYFKKYNNVAFEKMVVLE